MKNKGYYLLILALALICALLGYKNFAKTEYVHQEYKVSSTPVSWYYPISKSINSRDIVINVDGNKKAAMNSSNKIYMSELLEIMFPMDIVSDIFDCSIHMYGGEKITIEKGSSTVNMTLNSGEFYVNDKRYSCETAPKMVNNVAYIPVSIMQQGLTYEYKWNVADNVVTLVNKGIDKPIPYSYDFRERGRNSCIKNQGKLGTCWAAASLTALETSIMPLENMDLSIDHMTLNNSFNLKQNQGGGYVMAIAYLTSWQGPVLTEDDPYNDGKSDNTLRPVKHVQEVQILASKNYELIKEMIFKYGGVQTSLYTNLSNANSSSKYYNKAKSAYCYIGTQKQNHDVVIIGWDDNYPKENFTSVPDGDGAFICQNSWGESFGEGGVFYVSYYDSNIGMHNVVYTRVDDSDNYDNIYQTDLCGMVGYMGYGKDTAYFANAYTATREEELKAVSFYATDIDTSYSVYVVKNFSSEDDLTNKRELVTSGKLKSAGYYTIDFNDSVSLHTGEKYAVIVKITTPNSSKPVAVEFENDSQTSKVVLDDGEGYISWSGSTWEDTEKSHDSNICLKAFTNNAS